MTYRYTSTKTFHNLGPVCFRQWRADSHCRLIHGYSLSFHFEFSTNELDSHNWVIDFGSLKSLKTKLEELYDHTLLVAKDDPNINDLTILGTLGLARVILVDKTGCEGIADFLYKYVNNEYLPEQNQGHRVWCTKVEVREHTNNSAMRCGDRPFNIKDTYVDNFTPMDSRK